MLLNNHRLGIAAGVLACALWGLVFLAPELTPGFTPMQLSAGRYLAYGLVAALLIGPGWRRLLGRLAWREWRGLLWLALTGNLVYYVLLAKAVQAGGVAMTSLVIGLLPVIVTVVGARDRHAVPLRRLLPSLALTMTGQLIVFETVFAVLYGFMWEQRWPTVAEGAALLLLLGGVALCAQAHRPQRDAAGIPRQLPAIT